MTPLSVWVGLGVVHWLACLALHGEPERVRRIGLRRRLEIHLVALGLSLALWPLTLARGWQGR